MDAHTSVLRRIFWRNALLTAALLGPLLVSFLTLHSYYPLAAWNVFLGAETLAEPRDHYRLRGERVSGEVIDLAPRHFAGPLHSGLFGTVQMLVRNEPLRPLREAGQFWTLHPRNEALAAATGPGEPATGGTHPGSAAGPGAPP